MNIQTLPAIGGHSNTILGGSVLTGNGVWAVYVWDDRPVLVGAYPNELDALRAAVQGRGDGVVWLPWGMDLTDAIAAHDAKKAQA